MATLEKLKIKTKIQILKPVQEVYEAIVDPEKMKHYFIANGTGRMEENKEIFWKFPEFPETFGIRVGEMAQDEKVSFYWESTSGQELLVKIELDKLNDHATLVSVTEGKMENDAEGIQWLMQNTEGWANFLACMKAYLEYGINLRKGAFDYMVAL